jgi:hypothetical protein
MYATRASFGYPVAFSWALLLALAAVSRACNVPHLPMAAAASICCCSWWSPGFEATGPAALLRGTLQGTVALMFAKTSPGDVELDMSHSQSYADWLSRHRVTAAIHRQEGEESPARRRQEGS